MPYDPQQNPSAAIEARLSALERRGIEHHAHTGVDSARVLFDDLALSRQRFCHTVIGAAAATATNYGVFFVSDVSGVVTKLIESHEALGTDAGVVTLNIEKLTSGQAPGAGATLLSTAFDLKASINVPRTGTLTATAASLRISPGDRLCLKDTGTLTAVSNVTVWVEITI